MCDREEPSKAHCSKSSSVPLLKMAKQTFIYRTFAFPFPFELPFCPLKSQTTNSPLSLAPITLNCPYVVRSLFIFKERGREGEREGEKYQCVFSSHVPPTGYLVHNPGTALTGNQTSDWFVAHTQSTELHQPGPGLTCTYILNLGIFSC